MTNPNEPTLTCSEVVERLAKCASMGYNDPVFNRELATKILHSWRERRVQELEECLREIVNERTSPDKYEVSLFRATKLAERGLAGACSQYAKQDETPGQKWTRLTADDKRK